VGPAGECKRFFIHSFGPDKRSIKQSDAGLEPFYSDSFPWLSTDSSTVCATVPPRGGRVGSRDCLGGRTGAGQAVAAGLRAERPEQAARARQRAPGARVALSRAVGLAALLTR